MNSLTKSQIRGMTSLQLYERLLSSHESDAAIKEELLRRKITEQVAFVSRSDKPRPPALEVNRSSTLRPPQIDREIADLYPDLNDVAAFYRYALDEGWRAEGMNDPDKAVDEMETSVEMNESLANIASFAPALGFYKAARRSFASWKVKQRR